MLWWSNRDHHLLVVFHCYVSFIKKCENVNDRFNVWTDKVSLGWRDQHLHLCPQISKCDKVPCLGAQAGVTSKIFELISRSVRWPTLLYVKYNLFIFTSCLPYHSQVTEIKQRNQSVSPEGQNQHRRKGFLLLCPLPLEQPPAICLLSHLNCNLQEMSQNVSLWLGLSPHRYQHAPLARSCCVTVYIDFAVEHPIRLLCHWAWLWGDIGAIDMWLIDQIVTDLMSQNSNYNSDCTVCSQWGSYVTPTLAPTGINKNLDRTSLSHRQHVNVHPGFQ